MKDEGQKMRDKLSADLRGLVQDTEDLIKATAGQAGEKLQAARSKVESNLNSAKSRIEDFEQFAMEKGKEAAEQVDSYVHENPWPIIGATAGVALLLGWLIGRK